MEIEKVSNKLNVEEIKVPHFEFAVIWSIVKMEPHQDIYYLFYKFLRRMYQVMGHDIFSQGGIFKPTFHTNFMYAFYLTYYVGVVKSLTISDLNLRLQAIAFLGFGLEVKFNFTLHFLRCLISFCSSISFFISLE